MLYVYVMCESLYLSYLEPEFLGINEVSIYL